MAQELDPDSLRKDFEIFRDALERGHSGVYRYTPKVELDQAFDVAKEMISQPMDVYEFFRLLAPVEGLVKCGHSFLALPTDIQNDVNTRTPLLPLDVRILEGRAYIFRDYATANFSLAGAEIRAINGVRTSLVLKTLLAATRGDGNNTTGRIARLERRFEFAKSLHDLLGIESPFRVIYLDSLSGKMESVVLKGIERPRMLEISSSNYPQDQPPMQAAELSFAGAANAVAVLKIHTFSSKHLDASFLASTFHEIHTKGSRTLILDLRDNDGGADEFGKEVFSFLTDQPFRYYNDLVINGLDFSFFEFGNPRWPVPSDSVFKDSDGKYHLFKHSNWGIQQPSLPTFNGRVLVLMNGGSFSTTSELLSTLHYHQRATFIGEEAGGGYYGNTSGFETFITLPYSKLILRLPLTTYYLAVSGYPHPDHGVMPDYPVRYTITELIAGKDKEMALALELAGDGTSTSQLRSKSNATHENGFSIRTGELH